MSDSSDTPNGPAAPASAAADQSPAAPASEPDRKHFGKRRFTEHEDKVVDQLLSDGWSHPKIAAALGRVSGPSIRARTTARRAKSNIATTRTRRACITCRHDFASSGPGHRMCKNCRRSASENPFEPHA